MPKFPRDSQCGGDCDMMPPEGKEFSMKAMVCEAFGGPEVLALRDVPDLRHPARGKYRFEFAPVVCSMSMY